jgi:hypothetical protein
VEHGNRCGVVDRAGEDCVFDAADSRVGDWGFRPGSNQRLGEGDDESFGVTEQGRMPDKELDWSNRQNETCQKRGQIFV